MDPSSKKKWLLKKEFSFTTDGTCMFFSHFRKCFGDFTKKVIIELPDTSVILLLVSSPKYNNINLKVYMYIYTYAHTHTRFIIVLFTTSKT